MEIVPAHPLTHHNLLDNAVKYGPAGQTVRVEVSPVGTEVHISVSDEGPGVPPDEREQVWAAFRRAGGHASVAGIRIGLSIVRDVAARHGGRAWVKEALAAGDATRRRDELACRRRVTVRRT